jgi:Spy/CpxP family protein refolding chaperone
LALLAVGALRGRLVAFFTIFFGVPVMKRVHCGLGIAAMALVALIAAAAEAQQGRGGFGFGGPGGRGLVSLAGNEAVQKDLGLSADVTSKLNTLNEDLRAARTKEYSAAGIDIQDFQNLTAEQRQKMTAIGTKVNEEFTPKLSGLLSADQMKRLKQINVQSQGAGALSNADVAADLALTAEQKTKLEALQTELIAKQRALFTDGGDFQERIAKMRELNSDRDKKALELLTAEQKTKFEALKGSPFDVAQLNLGGRGRRGNN